MTLTSEPAQRIPNNVNWFQSVGAHIANMIITLGAAWFLFAGTQDTNQTAALKIAYDQIDTQGKEIIELRGMLLTTQVEIITLKSKLSENLSKTQMLESFLNYLPFPAWIKTYDNERQLFIMYMVNDEYTATYGITRQSYLGRSDYDVHPVELARQYEKNDLEVLANGRAISKIENVILSDGTNVEMVVYKFPIPLSNGVKGIGGASIQF